MLAYLTLGIFPVSSHINGRLCPKMGNGGCSAANYLTNKEIPMFKNALATSLLLSMMLISVVSAVKADPPDPKPGTPPLATVR